MLALYVFVCTEVIRSCEVMYWNNAVVDAAQTCSKKHESSPETCSLSRDGADSASNVF